MSLVDFSKKMIVEKIDPMAIPMNPRSTDQFIRLREEFMSQIALQDTVYYYVAPPALWDAGQGSEGYIVVRNGQIIADLVTRMN